MAKVGLVTSASVPDETSLLVTVFEDIDQDGEEENSATQSIHDGVNKYALSGFEVSEGSLYKLKVELETDNIEKSPALSGAGLDLVPKSVSDTGANTNDVKYKLEEAEFFLQKLSDSTDKDELRYYLSGYLSSIYSIDEILRKNYEFESWSDNKYERELHSYLIDKRHDTIHLGRSTEQPQVNERITGKVDFGEDSDEFSMEEYQLSKIPKSVWVEYRSEDTLDKINVDGAFQDVSEFGKWRSLPVEKVVREHLNIITSWVNDWLQKEQD